MLQALKYNLNYVQFLKYAVIQKWTWIRLLNIRVDVESIWVKCDVQVKKLINAQTSQESEALDCGFCFFVRAELDSEPDASEADSSSELDSDDPLFECLRLDGRVGADAEAEAELSAAARRSSASSSSSSSSSRSPSCCLCSLRAASWRAVDGIPLSGFGSDLRSPPRLNSTYASCNNAD